MEDNNAVVNGIEELHIENAISDDSDIRGEDNEQMDDTDSRGIDNIEGVIEAILFAMGDSVEYKKLSEVTGYSKDEIREIIHKMQSDFRDDPNRGVEIVELEDSVQMCTKTSMYEYLIKVAKTPKNMVLSDTLLETLSIIAYKQPVTRAEIEKIRGVSCDHAINKLLEFNLICELGRLNAPGRPLLFGTTEEFLRSFGVKSVDDLPTIAADRLEEFKKEAAEEVQLKLDI